MGSSSGERSQEADSKASSERAQARAVFGTTHVTNDEKSLRFALNTYGFQPALAASTSRVRELPLSAAPSG